MPPLQKKPDKKDSCFVMFVLVHKGIKAIF
jgi:hypothetical protein